MALLVRKRLKPRCWHADTVGVEVGAQPRDRKIENPGFRVETPSLSPVAAAESTCMTGITESDNTVKSGLLIICLVAECRGLANANAKKGLHCTA